MPRPPNKTLYDISPDRLGRDVSSALRAHAASLACHVGQDLVDSVGLDVIESSITCLARYAIRRDPLQGELDHHLACLMPLWTRCFDSKSASSFDPKALADPDTVDPSTWQGQLTLVLRAAIGWAQIESGHAVLPADLAVMGGMSARNLRASLRSGEIGGEQKEGRWEIPADEARRWLADVLASEVR